MVQKILLDTNFLIDMLRYRAEFSTFQDIEGGVEFFVSSEVLREIKSIANRRTRVGRLALIALKLIDERKIKVVQSLKKTVDEDLVALAKTKGFIVATNDKNLKERLKRENVRVICLRNKKKIEVM
ncbi:MAG: PIN domain-containing protein [Candidatus Aenigmarchaeota archaeon]|nr:PIN domain-containing protein [Candidatus Aenigmarchaeota archaeon]